MRTKQHGRFYIGEMAVLAALGIIGVVVVLWLWPKYRVYSQELAGQAKLREAEWSKKILIEEARAQEQAALLQAQAKVTLARAQGAAEVERAATLRQDAHGRAPNRVYPSRSGCSAAPWMGTRSCQSAPDQRRVASKRA